jgi:protein TonB
MFGVLLESNPRPRTRRGVTIASVTVHAGLILLGVWATAETAEPVARDEPEALRPVFQQPASPASPTPVARRPDAGPSSVSVPHAPPTIPVLPDLEIRDGIPPLEESLGDPFSRSAFGEQAVVNGVSHGYPVLAPGGVLDNRSADKPALPLSTNAPPSYPDALRSAAIDGTVEVEFIIDPNGRMRPGSIVVLRADHPLFLEAVKRALAGHRYLPAEASGSPVAVRVRQRFAFRLDG